MLAKEIKTGMVVVNNDAPVIIEGIAVQSPSARGAATLYKFRGRDLITRQKVTLSLRARTICPKPISINASSR